MNTATPNGIKASPQTRASASSAGLPDIELRLSPLYTWLLIGFGAIFFVIGLLFASPAAKHPNIGLGILICAVSAAAIIGGNYWRHHLPVVAAIRRRGLYRSSMQGRPVTIEWSNIAEIEKKTINMMHHGVRHGSEVVFIKLNNPIPAKDRLSENFAAYKRFQEKVLKGIKDNLLGGYDFYLNPQDEFLRSADWFISECKKRMDLAAGSKS
jgi:hypothetical protein